MKFIKAALKVATPEPLIYTGHEAITLAPALDLNVINELLLQNKQHIVQLEPEPQKITIAQALGALGENGIWVKALNTNTSYSYDGMEIELSMTLVPDPKTFTETMASLNEWYVNNTFYGKAKKT